MEKEEIELCIVYDKATKPQAKWLSNKLSEKLVQCMCFDEKTWLDEEKTSTNYNKVLLFSQSLVEENFPKELTSTSSLCKGVSLASNGNMHGIIVDPSVIVEKSYMGRNWWKYLISLFALGLIGATLLTTYLLIIDPRKKARIKLYSDAATYLATEDNISIIIPKQICF